MASGISFRAALQPGTDVAILCTALRDMVGAICCVIYVLKDEQEQNGAVPHGVWLRDRATP